MTADVEDLARLKDSAAPWADRRAALTALASPGALLELRRRGTLEGVELPGLHEGLAGDELFVVAALLDPARIEGLLSPHGAAAEVILGGRLAGAAARADPLLGRTLEPALRGRLSDRRPAWPGRAEMVGQALQASYAALVGAASAGDDGEAFRRAALGEALPLALDGGGLELTLAWAWRGGPGQADLARALEGLVADAARGPTLRAAAARATFDLASQARGAPPEVMTPDERAAWLAAWERVSSGLPDLVGSPETPAALRDAVLAGAPRWLGPRIDDLQRAGRWPVEPILPWRLYKDRKDAEAVRRQSVTLRVDEVAALLRDAETDDAERVYAAVRFVPVLASYRPDAAAQLAPALVPVIPSVRRATWAGKDKPISMDLGVEAWTSFERTLWTLDLDAAPPAWLAEALAPAVAHAAARGLDLDGAADFAARAAKGAPGRRLRADLRAAAEADAPGAAAARAALAALGWQAP